MVDNTTLPGTGETYASDDIGGVKWQRIKVAAGADGSATDISDAFPLPTKGKGLSAAVSVTRPSNATPYTANDVTGVTGGGTACMDFNLAAASGSQIMITSVALERDVAALISGETSYNLYFYNVTAPSALTDNDPFDIPSGDRASFLGKISIPPPADEGSTLYIEVNGINKQVTLSGTHIFAYLVTVGAYTPVSATVHKVTVSALQL